MTMSLLVCFLRRKQTTISKKPKKAIPEKKRSSWSMRSQLPNCPHKSCRERASSQPPKELPVTSDAEQYQAEDSSDSEFVLPALGGPDPHNKFDGMEWVDIKGMDDDKLQDISTDLRLYYKRMNGC